MDELHGRLLAAQQKSVSELKRVQLAQFDATEIVQKTVAAVRGRPFLEALLSVALLVNPPNVKRLREQTLENMKFAPLMSSLPATVMNVSGKTVAKHRPRSRPIPKRQKRLCGPRWRVNYVLAEHLCDRDQCRYQSDRSGASGTPRRLGALGFRQPLHSGGSRPDLR